MTYCISSVFQFSLSVVSNSLQYHGLQHARIPCPSPTPRIGVWETDSCPLHRWCHPKYWSFTFSISTSSEYSGLISFRIDWFDLLEIKRLKSKILESLLQHHSSKASILQCSAFLHPYMTIGITIALTRWTFVGKVMSLLFNMLSRLVITFLPRNKHLLISWLQWF